LVQGEHVSACSNLLVEALVTAVVAGLYSVFVSRQLRISGMRATGPLTDMKLFVLLHFERMDCSCLCSRENSGVAH